MKLPLQLLRVTALVVLAGVAAPGFAEENTLKEGAREVGHAVGSAAREVGQGAKKVGKAVGEAAKEVGQAVKEGAKEAKKAMKGDK